MTPEEKRFLVYYIKEEMIFPIDRNTHYPKEEYLRRLEKLLRIIRD